MLTFSSYWTCKNEHITTKYVIMSFITYVYVIIGISIQMSTSWVDFTVSNVIVQIDIVWYIFETRLETKLFASWTKDLFCNIKVNAWKRSYWCWKILKKINTQSYLYIYILSNMTNNNWFVCILCYCKSNIDTGKIPS
jgi:hypothetical protein